MTGDDLTWIMPTGTTNARYDWTTTMTPTFYHTGPTSWSTYCLHCFTSKSLSDYSLEELLQATLDKLRAEKDRKALARQLADELKNLTE